MMRLSTMILAYAAVAQALESSEISKSLNRGVSRLLHRKAASCPPVWANISKILTPLFLSDGQCTDAARAAIRMIFHDCGAWDTTLGFTNGCDGSLQFELSRADNTGLTPITKKAVSLATQFNVTVADMINFMGNHAIVTCPGGPKIMTLIGRTDATKAGVEGRLPNVHAPAEDTFKLFQAKGFNAVDLAALLGAHSTSRQFGVDPSQAGKPQDTTPGIWDTKYYFDTTAIPTPENVFVFPSDAKLAVHPAVGKEFTGFAHNQGRWSGRFAEAMSRMALFGNDPNGMIDCTNSLPSSTNMKRGIKSHGTMERVV